MIDADSHAGRRDGPTLSMVVLRHRPGPGFDRGTHHRDVAVHWDWMFELSHDGDDDDRCLRTYATPVIIETSATSTEQWLDNLARRQLSDGPISAERLPNHRRRYLRYEGGLSGDRGRVDRIVSANHHVVRDQVDRFETLVENHLISFVNHSSSWTVEVSKRC